VDHPTARLSEEAMKHTTRLAASPTPSDPDLAAYELQVRSHLDGHWADWFDATRFDHGPDGTTTIRTAPIDHARLHGVLLRLFNFGGVVLRLEHLTDQPLDTPPPALTAPLSTVRLHLRPATPADADATWAYRRLPEVAEWLTELPADADAYRRDFADPARLAATVIVERDGVVVGDFMLLVHDAWAQAEIRDQARRRQAELGWTLDPAHTGHGYATEAAQALMDHCFTDLGIHRVTANCFDANTASVRLIERLGMRLEQHAVEESLHRLGRWLDTLQYALLDREWAGLTARTTTPPA
jgi:RimJ/RimL family protein N-acetyltransferase